MSITFDRSLVTGNELIDTQHRELISRVNKLAEECVPGTGRCRQRADYCHDSGCLRGRYSKFKGSGNERTYGEAVGL